MMNRIWTYISVLVVGGVLGTAVAVHHNTMNSIVEQLTKIASLERRIEQRLATIEEQQTQMNEFFQRMQRPAPQPQAARPQPPSEDFNKQYTIPVAHSPIRGKKDAPVTIVEFLDFQCPFCARFHPPIQQVLKAYPRDVRYIAKNFPLSFHPQARSAAKAAFAAGQQGKYFEMADLLLKSQQSLSEETYQKLAEELNLNVKRFMNDYSQKDAQWEEYINADMVLAGQVAVRGTPTFYINGRKTRARDFDGWKDEIDQLLQELR